MDGAIIFAILINVIPVFGYFGFRLWQCHCFRKQAQTQAKVVEVHNTLGLFSYSPEVTLEYADNTGTVHLRRLRPIGYRSYKVGDNLDIAYKSSNPKEMMAWNGQEGFYTRMLIWCTVGLVAFLVSIPYMKEYSAKQAAIKAASSHNNP